MAFSYPDKKREIGVVLPVFNVELTIEAVLMRLKDFSQLHTIDIFLIDNCSTDRTLALVEKFLSSHKTFSSQVSVIRHRQNYGYGCSIKAGFQHFQALDRDFVAIIHGDYQSDPYILLQSMVDEIHRDVEADIVLLSRFKSGSDLDGYSIARRVANQFFNLLTRICTGRKMSDAGTAIIILRTPLLDCINFAVFSNGWHFHPQLNIVLYRMANISIREIPMVWRDSDNQSTVPLFGYAFSLFLMLLRVGVHRIFGKGDIYSAMSLSPMPADRQFEKLN